MSWHWILIVGLAASLLTCFLMILLNRLRFINIGFEGGGDKSSQPDSIAEKLLFRLLEKQLNSELESPKLLPEPSRENGQKAEVRIDWAEYMRQMSKDQK